MRNENMPANPIFGSDGVLSRIREGHTKMPEDACGGLTKRERFALAAMQGICSNPSYGPTTTQQYRFAAEDAVKQADAVLKHLWETD